MYDLIPTQKKAVKLAYDPEVEEEALRIISEEILPRADYFHLR
jgi:hypothetical protein